MPSHPTTTKRRHTLTPQNADNTQIISFPYPSYFTMSLLPTCRPTARSPRPRACLVDQLAVASSCCSSVAASRPSKPHPDSAVRDASVLTEKKNKLEIHTQYQLQARQTATQYSPKQTQHDRTTKQQQQQCDVSWQKCTVRSRRCDEPPDSALQSTLVLTQNKQTRNLQAM